jgi:hypothetical protein
MSKNQDPNTQYKKMYKGLTLIRPNLDTMHKMATRSSQVPHIVIQWAQRDTHLRKERRTSVGTASRSRQHSHHQNQGKGIVEHTDHRGCELP